MGLRWGRWGVVSMAGDISGCVFRVLTGAFDLAAFGPTMFWGDCVHIHCCGNGGLGFRPYGESLWQTPQRNQRSRPERPAPRLGSAFLRSGIHLGASPPVGFASTSSRCVRLRRTALRACPPDEHLHSACRRGGWIKIKSCRRANARPDEW